MNIKDSLDKGLIHLGTRIVLPPMATEKSDGGRVTDSLCRYYEDRAANPLLGLIITEHMYIAMEGRASKGQLSIAEDEVIDGLKKLTDTIHKAQSGIKVFAQINHAGGKVDPDRILREAGREYIGEITMRELIENLHKEYSFASLYDVEIAHLLSGMMNKHFSFTSCGFFFSDISGIEPRQDIKYALYAIRMFQPYCKGDLLFPFLSDLRKAKSNIKAQGDGMNIAQEEMKGLPGEAEAALYFFLNRMLARPEDYNDGYGRFTLCHMDIDDAENFSADITDTVTLELFRFTVLASSSIDSGLNLYLCENDETDKPINRLRLTNQDIPDRMLDEVYSWIDNSMNRMTFTELSALARDMRHFSMLVKNSRYIPMETMVMENLGLTLKIIKSLFTVYVDVTPIERKEILGNMVDFVRKCGRDADIASISAILSKHSEYLASVVRKDGLTDKTADSIIELLTLSRAHGFEPDTKELQDAIYPYYDGEKKAGCDDVLLRSASVTLNFK